MSLIVVFIFVFIAFDDSDVLVESEDGACQQERLCHIVEQASGYIVDFDYLISHECDTAHDEQHRTGILRDFKALFFPSTSYFLHLTSYISVASPAAPRSAAMM